MQKNYKSEYAIIVRTNYTIFNAINIVLNNGLVGKVDLYVELTQEAMNDTIRNLGSLKIFNNVYIDRLINVNCKKTPIKTALYRILNLFFLFFPKQYLGFHFGTCCLKLVQDYSEIFSPYIDLNTRNMIICSKCSQFNLYEDGLGTYNYDYKYDFTKMKYKIMGLLLGLRSFQPSIKKIYINNISIYKNVYGIAIVPIEIKSEYLEIHKRIFYIDNPDIYRSKIVYIGQPVEFDTRLFNATIKAISHYDNYVIRLHPGESLKKYVGYKFVKENSLWELICNFYITDKNILIGFNSTALMSPKILYNKEPYVIFTFEIFKNSIGSIAYSKVNNNYKMLQSMYENKSKIMKPNSVVELEKCIGSIAHYVK